MKLGTGQVPDITHPQMLHVPDISRGTDRLNLQGGGIEVKAIQNYASYAFISKDYAKFRKEPNFVVRSSFFSFIVYHASLSTPRMPCSRSR